MLKIIPKRQFHKCFQQWRHCWAKCAAEKGVDALMETSLIELHV